MTPAAVTGGGNPFNPRVVLGMVLFGAGVFLALLWMIGSGMTGGKINDGNAHAGSRGLTGYAALSALIEGQGNPVRRGRAVPQLKAPGLLVLTPTVSSKSKDIVRIIADRRRIGPTLLVLPKWAAVEARQLKVASQDGWVKLLGIESPGWPRDLGDYAFATDVAGQDGGRTLRWSGLGMTGTMPDPHVQFGSGRGLASLIMDDSGHMLAGYFDDTGRYPALADAAGIVPLDEDAADKGLYPLVIVFDPDLINNWGMASEARARAAQALIDLARDGRRDPVTFDLTLNGLGRSANLLTLAFSPPFLAATLCLLIAAIVAGWRAFRRFGPPLAETRAIAFGKASLVANAAGLVRRSGRLHLLGAPYAALLRERLVRALALPRHADPAMSEAAIDRALAARDPVARPFSHIAAELRAARRPAELLRAGQALHALERTLTR